MNIENIGKPYVGGQAVLEGVMMRSPRCLAVAVRRPDGSIAVRDDAWISLWERLKFLRWPFFRGSVILVESVYNGVQALNFSAAQAGIEEVAARRRSRKPGSEAHAAPAPEPEPEPASAPAPKDDRSSAEIAGTIALSFVIALGLFVGLPHLLAWGAGRAAGADLGVQSFGFHALDGLFKISIFVAYVCGIGMIPEIRRVFQYHGAEHMAINTYESGKDLTVANAQSFTTFHPRCGTSFVLFVLLLSIFLFAGVFPFVPRVSSNELLNHLAMVVIKIPLMLPLAGIAYEINRYASKHPDQLWVQALVVPGRLMQRLTTREPSADQLEIALAAMGAALRREAAFAALDAEQVRAAALAEPEARRVLVYRDFGELSQAMAAVP